MLANIIIITDETKLRTFKSILLFILLTWHDTLLNKAVSLSYQIKSGRTMDSRGTLLNFLGDTIFMRNKWVIETYIEK